MKRSAYELKKLERVQGVSVEHLDWLAAHNWFRVKPAPKPPPTSAPLQELFDGVLIETFDGKQ